MTSARSAPAHARRQQPQGAALSHAIWAELGGGERHGIPWFRLRPGLGSNLFRPPPAPVLGPQRRVGHRSDRNAGPSAMPCCAGRGLRPRLVADLVASGGEVYARLGILAFRQCLAAHMLVEDFDGDAAAFFQGKQFQRFDGHGRRDLSGAPFFLHFNPALLRAQMRPVLAYAAMRALALPLRAPRPRPLPLGQWPELWRRRPHRARPDAGRGVRQHADPRRRSWRRRTGSTASGRNSGRSSRPGRTISSSTASIRTTSSAPTISPATCRTTPISPSRRSWASAPSASSAGRWVRRPRPSAMAHGAGLGAALGGNGQRRRRYRLAFDQPGSWSQKYNLIWDRVLGLDLFAQTSLTTEMALYRDQAQSLRPAARQPRRLYQARLAGLDGLPDRAAGGFRHHARAGRRLARRCTGAGATLGLVRNRHRQQPHDHGFFARSVVGGMFFKLLIDHSGRQS